MIAIVFIAIISAKKTGSSFCSAALQRQRRLCSLSPSTGALLSAAQFSQAFALVRPAAQCCSGVVEQSAKLRQHVRVFWICAQRNICFMRPACVLFRA
jgi:hypothetical protein